MLERMIRELKRENRKKLLTVIFFSGIALSGTALGIISVVSGQIPMTPLVLAPAAGAIVILETKDILRNNKVIQGYQEIETMFNDEFSSPVSEEDEEVIFQEVQEIDGVPTIVKVLDTKDSNIEM